MQRRPALRLTSRVTDTPTMAVELSEYIGSLQRAVTPIGTPPPTAADDTWIGYLSDAFWEARLDGFMVGYTANEDGVITPLSGDEDLDRRWVSLVVMYAAIKALTNRVISTQVGFRAKAGPVEFETQGSASTLTEMLKQLGEAKRRLLADLRDGGQAATDVMLIDAFSVRALSSASYYGSALLTES